MSERPDKTPWQRHWMIRRRANWLRDMMASDLGGPAKVAGYALATFLDERSMTAHQVAQKAIAGAAGMSERQLRDALGYLICEGWIECKDEGRHANSYRAIERGDLMGPECCEAEKGRLVRRKTAGIKTDVVRRKNVSCEAEKGPLSGGKPPHLYSIVTVDSRAFEESPDTLPNDTPSPEAADRKSVV